MQGNRQGQCPSAEKIEKQMSMHEKLVKNTQREDGENSNLKYSEAELA